MTTKGQRITEQTAQMILTSKLLWNAVAPVSRLPLEVLACIFLYCARRDHYESRDDSSAPRWINVSYVCSRWRYVALSYPTLWSYLFVVSPRWTDASLIRSKQVPLSVRIYFTFYNREIALEFVKQVAPYAQRFRECHLDLQPEDAECVLLMLSSRPAPLLQALVITCNHFPHSWVQLDADAEGDSDVDEDAQAVGPHALIFDGHTPALRELTLNDSLITWCSPTLGGLTVLRLCDLHYSARPTVAEFMVMLSRMPDLTELYLDNAIRAGPHDSALLDTKKIHLPRLAYLLLAAPLSRIVPFLSCIGIPVTTRVRLGCHFESHSYGDNYASFYALLSQISNNSEASVTPIRTMVMDNWLRRTTIVFSKSEPPCSRRKCSLSLYNDCACDIPLKVDIDQLPNAVHWNDLIIGICRSVPLASLRNLILDRCRLPSEFWSDVVWHLQELRYIVLTSFNLVEIITVFALPPRPLPEDLDKPADQRTSQLFAPSLEELCLDGVRFPRGFRSGGNLCMLGGIVMLFRDGLARRKAAGHALRRLLIRGNMPFSQQEVSYLAEVISQIRVERCARLVPSGEFSNVWTDILGIDMLPDSDSL